MQNDFLLKEYEECFNHLRFYDDRQMSLLKFAITVCFSISSGLFALYSFIGDVKRSFWLTFGIIGMIVFVGMFILLWSMVQNRLYYIYPAKQINAIRHYLLQQNDSEFIKNNQMYLSTNISAFKWNSVQTLFFFGVSLLCFGYLFVTTVSFVYYFKSNLILGCFFGGIISLFGFVVNLRMIKDYLDSSTKKTSDEAIHKR